MPAHILPLTTPHLLRTTSVRCGPDMNKTSSPVWPVAKQNAVVYLLAVCHLDATREQSLTRPEPTARSREGTRLRNGSAGRRRQPPLCRSRTTFAAP
jgi:hypothetical protein